MTMTMHPYAAADMQRVIDFRLACTTHENINDYPTVVDLYEITNSPSTDDSIQICLWEDDNGTIKAYTIVALKYCNLYFLLHPQVQNSEIESQVLEWGRDQIRACGGCSSMDTPCRDTDRERVALLERHGFTCSDVQTLYMARSLAEPFPPPQFPAGFELRQVGGEYEVDAIVALHKDAFGTQHMTRDHRLSIMRNPEYLPELDLLLVAPDGSLAAFCYCTIPKESNEQSGRNEGEIAIVGTRPAYKNRGLGRAMVLTGLQHLKKFGVETATLGTSSENISAQSVFVSVGFRTVYKSLWYFKSV